MFPTLQACHHSIMMYHYCITLAHFLCCAATQRTAADGPKGPCTSMQQKAHKLH